MVKGKKTKTSLLDKYNDPEAAGSLGGIARFVKAQGISLKQPKKALQQDLSYTLHRPRRTKFPKAKVMVYGIDHQWVADLIDVQKLARNNRGYKYLLTVVDALSKFAWVIPLKTKRGEKWSRGSKNFPRGAKTHSTSNRS